MIRGWWKHVSKALIEFAPPLTSEQAADSVETGVTFLRREPPNLINFTQDLSDEIIHKSEIKSPPLLCSHLAWIGVLTSFEPKYGFLQFGMHGHSKYRKGMPATFLTLSKADPCPLVRVSSIREGFTSHFKCP